MITLYTVKNTIHGNSQGDRRNLMYVFPQEVCSKSATVTKPTLQVISSWFWEHSWRCENSNSVFLGQTNYRDHELGRDD